MKKLTNLFFMIMSLALVAAISPANLVDPTRPPDAVDTTTDGGIHGPLTLTAVFSYPGYFMAIISQQMVLVGDQIGDISVTSITPNAVVLTGEGDRKLVLTLAPDIKHWK